MKGIINGQIQGIIQNKRRKRYSKSVISEGKNKNTGKLPSIKEESDDDLMTPKGPRGVKNTPLTSPKYSTTEQL